MINGAESLVNTLVANNVNVCFANPGTSEIHFLAALDKTNGIRCILGLFEGVATGAADGYYRMLEKPASTLLHLGPGLANGLANLHNAKKANSGIVNVVGQHALKHIAYDAPLNSDIEALASPMSHWVKTSKSAKNVSFDGAEAIRSSIDNGGQIATLILPANTAWEKGSETIKIKKFPKLKKIDEKQIKKVAISLLSKKNTALLLGGKALTEDNLLTAGKIASKTKCDLIAEGSNSKLSRGAGRVSVHRIPYVVDKALKVLKKYDQLILVGSKAPVAFFSYPNKPSLLYKKGTNILKLVNFNEDITHALKCLSSELEVENSPASNIVSLNKPEIPNGKISQENIAKVLGALIPENAIVVDESVSTGRDFFFETSGSPPHDWINNKGGSIGYGMPVAIGASIACPDRKVILLEGDGSGMYTIQSLWTMAREKLDITIIVFANRSYNILKGELQNLGIKNYGPKAINMLSLDNPHINWTDISKGLGVDSKQASNIQDFVKYLSYAIKNKGPFLIELIM